eukprot:TRINITY_DN9404_c0_g1_i1.p1 TRINITY_DN9404_c0_g1~~TRINITY_DN9404_c0_g1_i1.p1  ORF type:complete len:395 (+),score=66.77 TRINITY_DN9404_c0_g1_i1:366-1550(+)
MSSYRTQGRLSANETRFPSGMKGLGDYLHSKGVQFALYTAESPTTCAGYLASQLNEGIDANTFASWGVDYMKVDGCGDASYYPIGYPSMGEALEATGRDIVYSCSWPAYLGNDEASKPFQSFLDADCNLWRNWDDIQCNWQSLASIIEHWGTYSEVLAKWAGPGHWNDPDMLLIGNTCINDDEARTQMAIWSIIAAPLIMGNDLRNVSDSAKAILLNREAIAVNQDPLGKQGVRISTGTTQVWARPLANGTVAVGLFNENNPWSTSSCSLWDTSVDGYQEYSVDLQCFPNTALDVIQQECCSNTKCAGFSYDPVAQTGCLKAGDSWGWHYAPGYQGHFKSRAADITVKFADVGLSGHVHVRDVWQQKDMGVFVGQYTAEQVPLHGTAFLKLSPA